MLKKINLEHWRQFEDVDIELHNRVTIITGANGSGKTTILNVISRFFGWNSQFVSSPYMDKEKGILKYLSSWLSKKDTTEKLQFGSLELYNGEVKKIMLSNNGNPYYNFTIEPRLSEPLKGVYIPSHRPKYNYSKVDTIPLDFQGKNDIFNRYNSPIKDDYSIKTGNYVKEMMKEPTYVIKQNLISLAVFGYGNKAVPFSRTAINIYEGFEDILRKVLPTSLGFERFEIQKPEVILVTKTGNFTFDAVSGGIASIIDLAWNIYMYDYEKFIVAIDEPENHLHPAMQKTLIRDFVEAFPNIQFIIATHSPFIISSTQESNVYVLDYNENNKVISRKLDMINKAGTSNDILRDVLGISSTTPLWVEEKLDSISDYLMQQEFNIENINLVKERLKEIGLEKYLGNILQQVKEGDVD